MTAAVPTTKKVFGYLPYPQNSMDLFTCYTFARLYVRTSGFVHKNVGVYDLMDSLKAQLKHLNMKFSLRQTNLCSFIALFTRV